MIVGYSFSGVWNLHTAGIHYREEFFMGPDRTFSPGCLRQHELPLAFPGRSVILPIIVISGPVGLL